MTKRRRPKDSDDGSSKASGTASSPATSTSELPAPTPAEKKAAKKKAERAKKKVQETPTVSCSCAFSSPVRYCRYWAQSARICQRPPRRPGPSQNGRTRYRALLHEGERQGEDPNDMQGLRVSIFCFSIDSCTLIIYLQCTPF